MLRDCSLQAAPVPLHLQGLHVSSCVFLQVTPPHHMPGPSLRSSLMNEGRLQGQMGRVKPRVDRGRAGGSIRIGLESSEAPTEGPSPATPAPGPSPGHRAPLDV